MSWDFLPGLRPPWRTSPMGYYRHLLPGGEAAFYRLMRKNVLAGALEIAERSPLADRALRSPATLSLWA